MGRLPQRGQSFQEPRGQGTRPDPQDPPEAGSGPQDPLRAGPRPVWRGAPLPWSPALGVWRGAPLSWSPALVVWRGAPLSGSPALWVWGGAPLSWSPALGSGEGPLSHGARPWWSGEGPLSHGARPWGSGEGPDPGGLGALGVWGGAPLSWSPALGSGEGPLSQGARPCGSGEGFSEAERPQSVRQSRGRWGSRAQSPHRASYDKGLRHLGSGVTWGQGSPGVRGHQGSLFTHSCSTLHVL